MKTLILNGWICDGSGNELAQKELLLENGKIKEIAAPGSFTNTDADIKIDATGKVVAPGFIDAHSHDDTRKLRYPQCKSKLLQGITTVIDGNCGSADSCIPGKVNEYQWQTPEEYAKIVKELNVALDEACKAKYAELTIDEIKELLVNSKWYYTIFEGIKALYVTTSHEIADRVSELAERYEDTLPSLESDVESYEAKVKAHLEKMGFVW